MYVKQIAALFITEKEENGQNVIGSFVRLTRSEGEVAIIDRVTLQGVLNEEEEALLAMHENSSASINAATLPIVLKDALIRVVGDQMGERAKEAFHKVLYALYEEGEEPWNFLKMRIERNVIYRLSFRFHPDDILRSLDRDKAGNFGVIPYAHYEDVVQAAALFKTDEDRAKEAEKATEK